MRGLKIPFVAVSALAVCLTGPTLQARQHGNHGKGNDDKVPGSVTVAFGTGNNNAQAGNIPNHHVLPQEVTVRLTRSTRLNGDPKIVPATVNFVVSGFHWPWVYKPGTTLEEVAANIPAAGTFVNYEVGIAPNSNVFAKGINPGTPPAFADAAPFPLSGAQNRTDTFAFNAPGRYLVICNVRGHFLDGMYAWVNVLPPDEKDDK
jgi:hypothetical protein